MTIDEGRKVDLNTATGGPRDFSRRLLVTNRSARRRQGTPMPSWRTLGGTRFSTIMELDQIEGISPDIFRALRLVTVRSGRPEPDMQAASPAMRRLLNFRQDSLRQPGRLPAGGSADPGPTFRRPTAAASSAGAGACVAARFMVREWRRGIQSGALPSHDRTPAGNPAQLHRERGRLAPCAAGSAVQPRDFRTTAGGILRRTTDPSSRARSSTTTGPGSITVQPL